MEEFPHFFFHTIDSLRSQISIPPSGSGFSWYHLTCSSFSFISCKYIFVYNTVEYSIIYNTVTYMERERVYHIRTQSACPARTF